jgi:hypothetical protein
MTARREKKPRDDRTAIELFITGVQGWDAGCGGGWMIANRKLIDGFDSFPLTDSGHAAKE